MISTVLPDRVVTMSPGRVARPSGMFSVQGMMPTTRRGTSERPSASNSPRMAAAPAMSPFISCILAAGFRLMPPVSKVMPLPTNTSGFWSSVPLGACSMTTSRGSSSAPRNTEAKAPMPISTSSTRPSERARMPYFFAMASACPARWPGVTKLGGPLTRSRARATPAAAASPLRAAACRSSGTEASAHSRASQRGSNRASSPASGPPFPPLPVPLVLKRS